MRSLSCFLLLTLCAAAQGIVKPNILIFYADDLGWQDTALNQDTGAGDLVCPWETPNMTALAADGINFQQGYSPQAVCAPSRVSLMNGWHPARNVKTHVEGGTPPAPGAASTKLVQPYYKGRMEYSDYTIAEALRDAGYFTGHVAKWHCAITHNASPLANEQGFEFSFTGRGVTSKMNNRYTYISPGVVTGDFATAGSAYKVENPGAVGDRGERPYDAVTENAIAFIAESVNPADPDGNGRPFFLYLAHWLVHTPIHQRDEVLLKYYCVKLGYDYDGTDTPGNDADDFNQFIDGNGNWTVQGQKNPFYGAMVDTLDWSLGKIVAYLQATDDPRNPGYKLYATTYIFFTSDNGGIEVTAGEQITDNAPLKFGKAHIDEGGVRVPFVVAGPGISPGGVSQQIVSALDFYPTILALTGAPGRASQNAHLDGVNLDPYLKGAETRVNDPNGNLRDALYFHFPHGVESAMKSSVRQGDFKLYKNYLTSDYSLYRLYDNGVRTDWEEATDLIGDPTHSATKEAMIAKLEAFLIETDAQPPYWNAISNQSIPNKNLVPAITGDSYNTATNTAAVTFEIADKAAIDRAYLLYTLNGGSSVEEWFRIPATVSAGTASAQVPAGTTHYVFNLIDANNFLRSSFDFSYSGSFSSQIPAFDPYNDSDNLYFLPGRAQPAETLGVWHMDDTEFGAAVGQLEETGDTLGKIGRSAFGFMGSALELTAAAGSGNQGAFNLITDDFSSGTVATTGAVFSRVGAGRTQSSGSWTVSGGALANAGNGTTGDKAVAWAIDVSGLSADLDGLDLSFNYTPNTAGEKLYVHIYGYVVENTPDAGSSMLNAGATNGNAWTSLVDTDTPATDKFSITNFVTGRAQGTVAPYRGEAAGAFEIKGLTGAQSFHRHFDLSTITGGGPANLGGYDYLVLAFARESNTDGSITIDDVQLTALTDAGAVPVTGRVRVSGSQTPGTYFPAGADPSLTLETWVKFNEVNAVADQCILDKMNGSGGYQLKLLAGTDQLAIRFGNATTASGSTGIVAGRWYHVAATWNGVANTAKIYLNGVEVASQQHAGAGVLTDSGSYLTFGNAAFPDAPFNGCLDEVRLSSTAYTFAKQPEFPPLYDPADPDTLAIYRMENSELGTGAGDLVVGPADDEHISFEIAEGFSGTALKNTGISGTDMSRITVKDSASGAAAAGIFPSEIDPSLSVEAWVRFDAINTAQDQYIFSSSSGNGYHLAMTAGNDKLRSQIRIGAATYNVFTSATGITPGSWHHVAITWNGTTNTSKIFLDFKQLASAQPAGADVIANGSTDLTIGNHIIATQTQPLKGMIDGLRIRSIAHNFELADYVVSETAAYAAWQQKHFDTNAIASGRADRTADADGDGFTNGQEFLLNFEPWNPANRNLPRISSETVDDKEYPTFSFTSAIGSEINYFVNWSSDLAQWNNGVLNVDLFMLPGSPANNGDGSQTVTLRFKDDHATTPHLFFQLEAQEP